EAAALSVAKYRYDVNGNRVAKIEPGQNGQPDKVISYLTDSSFPYAQVVQETSIQGVATESTRYVWGSSLIGLVRGGQGVFYHQDGLGSTKALTDQAGNQTDAYQYDAYGAVLAHAGTTVNGYRYTGEYFDDSISLQYNRARWYAPTVGRFVSIDSFPGFREIPSSLNVYLYAGADAINAIDPSGHVTILDVTLADFQQKYGKGKEAQRRYDEFNRIRTNLCQTCLKIGKKAGSLHHLLPKFGGGSKKNQELVRLPEEIHAALHRLLEVLLVLNSLPHPTKGRKVYNDLFARSPGAKIKFHESLRDTAEFIDTVCYGTNQYKPKLSEHLKDLLDKFQSLDF
ncbi:MAG: tRNA nuclease WapA precursor, partial [Pseudomonadota bacterium]